MYYFNDISELTVDEFLFQYKKKWIAYCEVIVLINGNIILANPSHTIRMGILSGVSKEKLDEAMPIYVSPIHWLVNYTGNVSVWYDFQIVPPAITKLQEETLKRLQKERMIRINYQYVTSRDCDTIPGVFGNIGDRLIRG